MSHQWEKFWRIPVPKTTFLNHPLLSYSQKNQFLNHVKLNQIRLVSITLFRLIWQQIELRQKFTTESESSVSAELNQKVLSVLSEWESSVSFFCIRKFWQFFLNGKVLSVLSEWESSVSSFWMRKFCQFFLNQKVLSVLSKWESSISSFWIGKFCQFFLNGKVLSESESCAVTGRSLAHCRAGTCRYG